jgi:hypothetical protein
MRESDESCLKPKIKKTLFKKVTCAILNEKMILYKAVVNKKRWDVWGWGRYQVN